MLPALALGSGFVEYHGRGKERNAVSKIGGAIVEDLIRGETGE